MRIKSLFLLFFLILFVVISSLRPPVEAQPVKPLNPVVFLPGILGSKLSEGQTVIWGNVLNTMRRFEELELPLDPAANRLNPSGILDEVQVFGPFQAGVYRTLLRTLTELGFKENQNLFVFPYDWRQSTLDGAVRLKEFIAQIRSRYGFPREQKFNIVAHSMGGMIARIFILRYGGGQDVERLITIATPHFGSLNAFQTLLDGLGGLENWVAGGKETVRRVAFSFPGLIELLASYQTCCVLGDPSDPGRKPISLLDFSLWTHYGWVPPAVFRAPGRLAFLEKAFQNAVEVSRLMETDLPLGVLQIMIVGDLIDTRGQVYLSAKNGAPIAWRMWGGDGTVVLQSATRGNWLLAQAVSHKHSTIFRDPRVGSNLKFALTEAVQQFRAQAAEVYVRVAGERVRVRSLAVHLDRPYYEIGSQAEILVSLVDIHGQPISGVDLQGSLLSGDTPLQAIKFAYSSAAPAGYRAVISVPSTVGSYRVSVMIPGMEDQEDFFVALPKQQPQP